MPTELFSGKKLHTYVDSTTPEDHIRRKGAIVYEDGCVATYHIEIPKPGQVIGTSISPYWLLCPLLWPTLLLVAVAWLSTRDVVKKNREYEQQHAPVRPDFVHPEAIAELIPEDLPLPPTPAPAPGRTGEQRPSRARRMLGSILWPRRGQQSGPTQEP